jgi:hypothetical protein
MRLRTISEPKNTIGKRIPRNAAKIARAKINEPVLKRRLLSLRLGMGFSKSSIGVLEILSGKPIKKAF